MTGNRPRRGMWLHATNMTGSGFGRPARAGGGAPRSVSLPSAGGETKRGGDDFRSPARLLAVFPAPACLLCKSLRDLHSRSKQSPTTVDEITVMNIFSTNVLQSNQRIPFPLPHFNLSNDESPNFRICHREERSGRKCKDLSKGT